MREPTNVSLVMRIRQRFLCKKVGGFNNFIDLSVSDPQEKVSPSMFAEVAKFSQFTCFS